MNSASDFYNEYRKLCFDTDLAGEEWCIHTGKDRYNDVRPSADHRVVLREPKPDQKNWDYINASHIDDEFIATQAPLPHTFGDFWQMCWEQDVSLILMLVDGTRTDPYWPTKFEDGYDPDFEVFGKIVVTFLREYRIGDLIVRRFKITVDEEEREITQVQWLGWPDQQVPSASAFLGVLSIYRKLRKTLDGKTVVHCSAGIGRTGTFISVVRILNWIDRHGPVCVRDEVAYVRIRRPGSVQTPEQYRFVHDIVEFYRNL